MKQIYQLLQILNLIVLKAFTLQMHANRQSRKLEFIFKKMIEFQNLRLYF